jgi:hypothetical protein
MGLVFAANEASKESHVESDSAVRDISFMKDLSGAAIRTQIADQVVIVIANQ